MFDLREYKGLVRRLISEANRNDADWHWSLKALSKTKASIFWSYLEYCGQPEPYFVIELEDTGNGCWIHAKDENGDTMESEIVTDNEMPFLNCPPDEAIEKMIHCIVHTAHNCY